MDTKGILERPGEEYYNILGLPSKEYCFLTEKSEQLKDMGNMLHRVFLFGKHKSKLAQSICLQKQTKVKTTKKTTLI